MSENQTQKCAQTDVTEVELPIEEETMENQTKSETNEKESVMDKMPETKQAVESVKKAADEIIGEVAKKTGLKKFVVAIILIAAVALVGLLIFKALGALLGLVFGSWLAWDIMSEGGDAAA